MDTAPARPEMAEIETLGLDFVEVRPPVTCSS
jgi:hypothetical protein